MLRSLVLLFVAALSTAFAQQPQQAPTAKPAAVSLSPELEQKRQQARQFLAKAQTLNALPLYEELAKAAPEDAEIQYGLAFCLYTKAKADAPPADVPALIERSRQAANKAKMLGYKSDLFAMLLSTLEQGNGLPPSPSANEEASQRLKEGEAAFARGDNDAAIAAYSAALKLDPKLYYAALYAGDACFRKKDIACSSEWFSKAIELQPDTETAHRYWGDALMAADKPREALDQYIEAIVANPYVKQTWGSLVNWGKKNNVQLASIRIDRPAMSDAPNSINIDPAILEHPETGRTAWTSYSIVRLAWRAKLFAEKYPKEPKYRHTLEEEDQALSTVVSTIDPKKATHLDPQLASLEKLKHDGLLSCWILLSGADQGIAQDYIAYREAHRDLLRRYLRTYVIQDGSSR